MTGSCTAGDRAAIKDFIARFKSENDPLRLLIVNAMLLTGFDAPIEQAMFLDRGLRDHTLMQAIARTNRRYPGKDFGIVLDYWGVFEELKSALADFAAEDLAGLVEDTEGAHRSSRRARRGARGIVAGAPSGSARRRMLWVVRSSSTTRSKPNGSRTLSRKLSPSTRRSPRTPAGTTPRPLPRTA